MARNVGNLAERGEDPNTQLLLISHEIRETESDLNIARTRQRLSNVSLVLGPVLLVVLFELFWFLRGHRNLMLAIYIPGGLLAVSFAIASAKLKMTPGGPPVEGPLVQRMGFLEFRPRRSESELELQLARLRDNRKVIAGAAETSIKVRRIAYRDEAYDDINNFREESARYRRVNNILQSILIIGSLAATAAASITGQIPDVRWATIAITFTVGIASGFMGYFKYKERSFYLQQTADTIESEWEAVDVGVGRYAREEDENVRLALFVEEVHRLKSEQKKRQQNLEQPPDSRSSQE